MRLRLIPLTFVLAAIANVTGMAFGQSADDASVAAKAPAQDELDDPAFANYVSIDVIRTAWANVDPVALADVGLQLAEGERVLGRAHKIGKADEVLRLAARVAAERGDKATLARLAKAAQASGKKQLATIVSVAEKTAGESRAAPPALMVALDDLDPAILSLYRAMKEGIESARLRGDIGELTRLAKDVDQDPRIPAAIRERVKSMASAAKKQALFSEENTPEVVKKLSGASRGYNTGTWIVENWISQSWAPNGVWVRFNFGSPQRIPAGTRYNRHSRTFTAPLGRRWLKVQRSDGSWHGSSVYQGKYVVRDFATGVFYVLPF